MNVGKLQEFKQQQLSKVERRKEEEKKIKKGIYQMHVMVEDQCMETLTRECEKSKKETSGTKAEEKTAEQTGQKKNKRTDAQTEMEKMLSLGGKSALRAKLNI